MTQWRVQGVVFLVSRAPIVKRSIIISPHLRAVPNFLQSLFQEHTERGKLSDRGGFLRTCAYVYLCYGVVPGVIPAVSIRLRCFERQGGVLCMRSAPKGPKQAPPARQLQHGRLPQHALQQAPRRNGAVRLSKMFK